MFYVKNILMFCLFSWLGTSEVCCAVDTDCRGRESQNKIIPSVKLSPLFQFTCGILSQYLSSHQQLVPVMHFALRVQSPSCYWFCLLGENFHLHVEFIFHLFSYLWYRCCPLWLKKTSSFLKKDAMTFSRGLTNWNTALYLKWFNSCDSPCKVN